MYDWDANRTAVDLIRQSSALAPTSCPGDSDRFALSNDQIDRRRHREARSAVAIQACASESSAWIASPPARDDGLHAMSGAAKESSPYAASARANVASGASSLPVYRFVGSLNEMNNSNERCLAGLYYNVPIEIMFLLVGVAMVAMGLAGYNSASAAPTDARPTSSCPPPSRC